METLPSIAEIRRRLHVDHFNVTVMDYCVNSLMWPDGRAIYLGTRENLNCLMPGNWQRRQFMACQAHHYDKQLTKGDHPDINTVNYEQVRRNNHPKFITRRDELLNNLLPVETFLTSGAIHPGRTAANRFDNFEEGENTIST